MKSALIVLTMLLSLNAMAFQSGMGRNGPWTVGPLGYTDPSVTTAGTSVGTTAPFSMHLKEIAIAVQNDSQEYFQSGEMSALLSSQVNNVLEQNSELSVDEAVTIVLEFAATHNI